MEQYLALLSLGSFDAKISDSKLAGYAKTTEGFGSVCIAKTKSAGQSVRQELERKTVTRPMPAAGYWNGKNELDGRVGLS